MSTTLVPGSGARVPLSAAPAVRALGRARTAAARLISWYAADPRRLQATVAGLGACTATGAVLGMAIGVAADAVVSVVHDTVVSGP